jgi:hypothetical protein
MQHLDIIVQLVEVIIVCLTAMRINHVYCNAKYGKGD